MVALIRSLLPGRASLLKPDTIALMMTNQLADGVWMRFPIVGELHGKGFGLAGGLIVEPSPFDHKDATGELYWGGVAGTQWWISPKAEAAGLMMTQRQMSFTHPFASEFKRLAYDAVKRGR
jgi:CubicO group peptidase (beta-lactamase class C family)